MLQVVQRWKVEVMFESQPKIVLWINENHPANVLRKLADLQFNESGLVQPTSIQITLG